MDKDLLQKYFFVGLLLIVSVLVGFIFLPFLSILVLSSIFGVILTPLHIKISKFFGGRKGISAFIVVLLFCIVVIIPMFFIFMQVLGESKDLYSQLANHDSIGYIQKITLAIEKPIQKIYPTFSIDLNQFASFGANWIALHLSSILSSALSVLTSIVFIFISLFFFLKDGSKFKKMLVSLSPLQDKYDEQIFDKLKQTITSTVRGVLLVAIIQGVLAGLGLKIFHVPQAILWGCIAAVASVIPFGTLSVYLLSIAYMYITGNIPYTIGLVLWTTVVIGLVDNFLGPYLYSRGVEIHQLVMLFAILGGLIVFGPVGFIFGPIVLSLFFTLINIYQSVILKKTSL